MIVSCHEIMPLIISALENGQHVQMTANGGSMSPFIHDDDTVELEMNCSLPSKGDIVLVQCSKKRYVIHRIVKIKNGIFFLRGDAQVHCEGPFTVRNIMGKVVKSFHNGHTRIHNKGIWYYTGMIWIYTYNVVRYVKFVICFHRIVASKLFRLITGTNFRAYIEKKRKIKS